MFFQWRDSAELPFACQINPRLFLGVIFDNRELSSGTSNLLSLMEEITVLRDLIHYNHGVESATAGLIELHKL